MKAKFTEHVFGLIPLFFELLASKPRASLTDFYTAKHELLAGRRRPSAEGRQEVFESLRLCRVELLHTTLSTFLIVWLIRASALSYVCDIHMCIVEILLDFL